jgi:glutathione S-transferase
MKLYHHPFSQHSRRVRMVCHELGITPKLVAISLEEGEHRSPAFLALNPGHAVPVLEDGDFVLSESHAIMKYLCAGQAPASERLYPVDRAARAKVDQWLDWNHCKLNPPIQTLVIQRMFMKAEADAPAVKTARDEANAALSVLDTALATRPASTTTPSLADISIGTTLALYLAVGEDIDATPRVKALCDSVAALPSFAATRPPGA